MKVLVIPDPHLKIWVIEHGLELAKKHRADKVIILGDYFDDWYCINRDYDDMLTYLKTLLRSNPSVEVLFGNHELSYMGFPCSGFNYTVSKMLNEALSKDYRFGFAIHYDGVLYSHAGVTLSWLYQNKVLTRNDIRFRLPSRGGAELLEKAISNVDKMETFAKVGPARGGKEAPSLVWADLTELIADPAPVKQVVGHTPVKEITNIGRVWFTDVFSNGNKCDEYLLVVDGEPTIVHYEEEEWMY